MKKLILLVLMLSITASSWAYDVEFTKDFLKVKKSAINKIVIKDGVMYDMHCTCDKDKGYIQFTLKAGTYDPWAKYAWSLARHKYREPVGEELFSVDGDYLIIPTTLFEGVFQLQIERPFFEGIEDVFDDILPFYATQDVIMGDRAYTTTVYK